MRRPHLFLLTLLLLPGIAGCFGDNPASPKTYTDSVTLGTGHSGNTLTGEASAFTGGNMTIYWRVESEAAFQAKDVVFEVEQLTDSGWSVNPVYSTIWEEAGDYDHVHVASYFHVFGPGTFRGRGYLGTARKLLGSVTFTVSEPAG